MPSSKAFVALQCYQCSTMQVKQEKKKGAKWRCVVCNQNQSVRSVFSRGYLAREIRNFVQSFNMARGGSVMQQENGLSACEVVEGSPEWKKPRVDWSMYLTQEEELANEDYEVAELDSKIGTDFPSQIPAKLKSRKLASKFKFDTRSSDFPENEDLCHSIQNRDIARKISGRCIKEFSESAKTKSVTASAGRAVRDASNKDVSTTISKWSAYLSDGVEDDNNAESVLTENSNDWNHDSLEESLHDENFDDIIHPDFM